MEILRTPKEMADWSDHTRREGHTIGLVPTMGCLHEGHLSLVRASRARTDRTVASIFVNPTQFGPAEDFEKYPRAFDRDAEMLDRERCDALFAPDVHGMYPEGFKTYVEVQELQDPLCGRSRPGHFRGVATVVAKLLNIVRPHKAFFGQKDAQQAVIVRRMARDLDSGTEIVVCPIVREPDGLAMSSRNAYLSEAERRQAAALYRSLREAEEMFAGGERRAARVIETVRRTLQTVAGARIDYVEMVDAETLQPLVEIARPALLAIAVYFGTTRLIDNTVLRVGRRE